MWLIIGLLFILVDVFLTQTLVLLLFGIGALTTELALSYDFITNLNQQIITFLGATLFWSLILWRPLTKARTKQAYSGIIGHQLSLITSQLKPGEQGEGKWSGTTVTVRLTTDSKPAKQGDQLTITKVDGITFFVTNLEQQNAI